MSPPKSVHRELIYNKGTEKAIAFAETWIAENGIDGEPWSTHDLVEAVIDGVWDDIKRSKG